MGYKENFKILSAMFMLVMGVTLCFCAFWTEPVGQIHESVLWYFAQCLIYAGSAIGIDVIIDNRINRFNQDK